MTELIRTDDRGVLDVDAPVASYWPEFAAAGKHAVTIAQVISHSAGLPWVPGYEEIFGTNGEGFEKTPEILRRLEAAAPEWPPGSAHGYHGPTYGWLVGELVRRVSGTSVGTLVREEIAGPLDLKLDLGTPVERQHQVAPIAAHGPMKEGTYSLSPFFQRLSLAKDGFGFMNYYDVMLNDPRYMAMEFPSFNATGTARAVAALYGALANGGMHNGYRVLTPATIEKVTTERGRGIDLADGVERRQALGFNLRQPPRVGVQQTWAPHDEAFGCDGGGGQIGFGDPVSKLGVCFVRSHHSWESRIGGDLVDAAYECLSHA